jgi:hypothetical protein
LDESAEERLTFLLSHFENLEREEAHNSGKMSVIESQ